MKNNKTWVNVLIVVFGVAFVALIVQIISLPSPFHLHQLNKAEVHTRFQSVGDYSFEVLSDIDEFGDFKIEVTNIKGEKFDYYQTFNDLDAIQRFVMVEMDRFKLSELESTYQFTIHKKSGFSVAPGKFENKTLKDNKNSFKNADITGILGCTPGKVIFNSASNFFNIY